MVGDSKASLEIDHKGVGEKGGFAAQRKIAFLGPASHTPVAFAVFSPLSSPRTPVVTLFVPPLSCLLFLHISSVS